MDLAAPVIDRFQVERRAGEGDIPSSEITPEHVYVNRRSFLKEGAAVAVAAAFVPGVPRAVRTMLGRTRDLAVGVVATWVLARHLPTSAVVPLHRMRPWRHVLRGAISNPGSSPSPRS